MRKMSIVPFSQLDPISQVPSIFTSLFGDLEHQLSQDLYRPSENITKEEDGYRVDLAVPGYDRDDIDIAVKDNTLTVEAKILDDSQNNYKKAFNVTSFKRQWTLPRTSDVDEIDATYKNGILSITIPSTKESCRKVKIELK